MKWAAVFRRPSPRRASPTRSSPRRMARAADQDVVPFSAGSSSDTIARIVAIKMGERLGQQVVVENRVGGSTIIGTDAVAKSAADGYTLLLANTTTHAASAALNATLPFDPVKDFAPVAMIGVRLSCSLARPRWRRRPEGFRRLAKQSPARSATPRPARGRSRIWPANCSSARPVSRSPTCPIAAARSR